MPTPAPRAPSNGALSALRQAALYGSLGVTTGASLLLLEERRRRICICKQIIERGQIVSAYRRHLYNVALANLRNEDPPELPFESPRPHPLSASEVDKAYARATGQRRRSRLPPDWDDEYNGEHVAALAGVKADSNPSTDGDHSLSARRRKHWLTERRQTSPNRRENSTIDRSYPGYGYGFFIPAKGHANDSRRTRSKSPNPQNGSNLEICNRKRKRHRYLEKLREETLPGTGEDGQRILKHPRPWPPLHSGPRNLKMSPCFVQRDARNPKVVKRLYPERLQEMRSQPVYFPTTASARGFSRSQETLDTSFSLRDYRSGSPTVHQLYQQVDGEEVRTSNANHPKTRKVAKAENIGSALLEFCMWYRADHPMLYKGKTKDTLWKRLLPRSIEEEDKALKDLAIEDLRRQDLEHVVDFFLEAFPAYGSFDGSVKASNLPDLAIILLGLAVEKYLANSLSGLLCRLKQWGCITPPVLQIARQLVPGLLNASREDDALRLLFETFGESRNTSLETYFSMALKETPEQRQANELLQELISFTEFENRWRSQAERVVLDLLRTSRVDIAVALIPEALGKSYSIGTVDSVDDFFEKAMQMPLKDQKSNHLLQEITSMEAYRNTWTRQLWRRYDQLLAEDSVIDASRLVQLFIPKLGSEYSETYWAKAVHLANQGHKINSTETVQCMYEWTVSMRGPNGGSGSSEIAALLVDMYARHKDYRPILSLFERHREDPWFYTGPAIRPAICLALSTYAQYSVAIEWIGNILLQVHEDDSVYKGCISSLPELLRRCWTETRKLSTVESIVRAMTKNVGFGGLPSKTISREMAYIRTLAVKDAQTISALEWSQQEPDTIGRMLVHLAGKAQWHTFGKVLEDAHEGGVLHSIPHFCDVVFNTVLKEYTKTHDSAATQRFVTNSIENYQVITNQRTLNIVLEALTKDSRIDAIYEWVQYLWAKGSHVHITTWTVVKLLRRFFLVHRPPHEILVQLTRKLCSTSELYPEECSSGWISKSIYGLQGSLIRKDFLPLLQASMAFSLKNKRGGARRKALKELENLNREGAIEENHAEAKAIEDGLTQLEHLAKVSPSLLHAKKSERQVEGNVEKNDLAQLKQPTKESPSLSYAKKLKHQIADVDHLAANSPSPSPRTGLEEEWTLALAQGKNKEIVNKYSQLLNQGLLGSQIAMEMAVEAATRYGGTAEAANIIGRARDLGMDVRKAQAIILHHQIVNSFMSPQAIHEAVISCFHNRSKAHIPPPHYIAVVAANHLIHRMKPRLAVALLKDVYMSPSAKEMAVDIKFMSAFLFAYGKSGNLRGVQWVVQTVLVGNLLIDRHFINIIKQVRLISRTKLASQALSDEMLSARLNTLNSVFAPWIASCLTRLDEQRVRAWQVGRELVEVLTKLRIPTSRRVFRRCMSKDLAPDPRVTHAQRRTYRQKVKVTRRKHFKVLVKMAQTRPPWQRKRGTVSTLRR